MEKRNGPVRTLFVSYTKRSLEAIFIFEALLVILLRILSKTKGLIEYDEGLDKADVSGQTRGLDSL